VHALLTGRRRFGRRSATLALVALAASVAVLPACRQKVSAAQCEALVARYAELVVREKMPDAPLEIVRAEQKRVRDEASGDEGFRNCTTEVGPREFDCAMAAETPDVVEKCLE
jgi:hypothetical protein